MTARARIRMHWTVVIGAFAAAVASTAVSVFSFTQVMIGHGSGAGNILRIGFGVLLLFIATLLIIVGSMSWQSTQPQSRRELSLQ